MKSFGWILFLAFIVVVSCAVAGSVKEGGPSEGGINNMNACSTLATNSHATNIRCRPNPTNIKPGINEYKSTYNNVNCLCTKI